VTELRVHGRKKKGPRYYSHRDDSCYIPSCYATICADPEKILSDESQTNSAQSHKGRTKLAKEKGSQQINGDQLSK
jgi:hypothetical protein